MFNLKCLPDETLQLLVTTMESELERINRPSCLGVSLLEFLDVQRDRIICNLNSLRSEISCRDAGIVYVEGDVS